MSERSGLPKSYDDDISRELESEDIVDAEIVTHSYVNPMTCECGEKFPHYPSLLQHLRENGVADPATGREVAIPEPVRRAVYDAPISRDEFNRLSALVAEHRNKIARLEEFMARMVHQQWNTGG